MEGKEGITAFAHVHVPTSSADADDIIDVELQSLIDRVQSMYDQISTHLERIEEIIRSTDFSEGEGGYSRRDFSEDARVIVDRLKVIVDYEKFKFLPSDIQSTFAGYLTRAQVAQAFLGLDSSHDKP